MATVSENRDFVSMVIGDSLLDEAIDYIQSNLDPEDVFESSDLEYWAERNDYKKEDE